MTPSREFWGDIRSDREIHRELTKLETTSGKDVSYEYLHLERGNSLLASMGAAGRDYFKLILDLQDQVEEYFIEPIEDNMLSMAASDIFHLRDRGDTDSNKGIIGWEDRSIEILSCHSPMREVEVLYDHLLLMFDKNPDLSPKDVLVMTPDMDTYAPFIHAVFGAPSGRIPFSIADRSIGKEGAITKGFLEILGLVDSRFEVSQVLSLLEISSIRDRFDLSEGDMARIRKLVSDSRICWGIDEIDRERLGLPATRENTWMAGLDRLILGYAMPGQEERLFKGILPYDYIEGGETKILGQFLTFTRLLFNDVASLGQPRSIELWSRDLKTLLEHFFIANEETQGEMQIIRRALHQLSAVENQIRFHEAVGLDVICCYLERVLGSQGHDYGFMTGGVTFCAMLPMRSIPFKVICLVGMNNTAYPRQSETVGFNLIVQNPKPGDQTHRDSDRYLFLETIISAREKLYISYVGQSMEDNTAIPPSALVCELMDYLEQGFMFPDAGSVLDKIATVHHLQAFNPSYFTGDQNLFSYSEENCRAARCLLEQSSPPAGLVPHSLSKPAEDWKIVELSDLLSFYRNPARFLSERRLGIGLEDASPLMEEVEPFKLSQLERYIFEQTIIEQALKGKELKAFYRLANAAGRLPHGQVGICAYDHLVESVRPFIEMLKHRLKGEKTEPLEFDLPVADFLLKGTIASLYPGGLIHYRFATLRGKDHLRFWIEHLVLNAVEGADVRQSFLFGKDEAWEMMPVAEASKWLATLVKQFWIGLMTPLKFFPEAAWIYVQQVYEKGKSPQEGIRKARERWVGNDFSPGEGEDAYYQLCFGEIEPLDSVFQKLAELIMSPLLQYQRKIKT
jgi:exodeoxyribonuclease V gamma subunit